MPGEISNSIHLSSEKNLLSSADEATPSQWDVVRQGLWQGVTERSKEAKNNLVDTGVEVGLSFGIAAGLVKAVAAGGRWKVAAEVAGVAFGAVMTTDLIRRGSAIHETYSRSNSDLLGNTLRKNAIAQNAGSALFDYSLILASAGVGTAASLRLNSRTMHEAANKPAATEIAKAEQRDLTRPRLMDTEKVANDLAFALDYQIPETAMGKISESLKQATHPEFNDIVRKLAEKDRKMQGMDLTLRNWEDAAQRWESAKLYHTDENMTTHLIVQRGDSVRRIAEKETSVIPNRIEDDIVDYMKALAYRNKISEQTNLLPGQILVLPYAS